MLLFMVIGYACVCGSFIYVFERDYFNIFSVDVYGVEMLFMGMRVENWNVGWFDIFCMFLKMLNGWIMDLYAAYVFV